MEIIHFSAEGTTEFKALIFIPSKNNFNILPSNLMEKSIHLYVKKIFITDRCKKLIPNYLRFLYGIVDSNDLPLNISRETLQDNPIIEKINKNIVRKVLDRLQKLKKNNPEKYIRFFKEFGIFIKEGFCSDPINREKLKSLLLFETMNNGPDKLISLMDYVEKMPPEQKEIYYAIGENRYILESSPHIEAIKSKGFNVLFMTSPIDEFVVQFLSPIDGKNLKAVEKGEIELDEDKKDNIKELSKEYDFLFKKIENELKEHIKLVRLSNRLKDSPCCLVGDIYDESQFMKKIMEAMDHNIPNKKRIMEINPNHKLIKALNKLYQKNPNDNRISDYIKILYNQALLREGNTVEDPVAFSNKINEIIASLLEKEE